jgi:hypothetical protein
LPYSRPFLFFARRCTLVLCFCAAAFAMAQSSSNQQSGSGNSTGSSQQQPPPPNVPGAPQPPPKPGDLGWPFPNQHWWNHVAMELGGGYSAVVGQGNGYYSSGYDGFGGLVDRATSRFDLLLEAQIFGQQSSVIASNQRNGGGTSTSTTIPSFDLAALYDFLPRKTTGIYVIGGAGFYRLIASTGCPLNECIQVPSASRAGVLGGVGIRHRITRDKATEIFVETRYHYIASGSTAFGQLSLLPITGGIRW